MTDLRIEPANGDAMLKDWQDVHNAIIPTDPLSLDDVRERVQRHRLEVAYLGEVPVGCSTVRPPAGEAGTATVIARVLPAYRGQGLGAELYEHGLERARELGAEVIETVVLGSNLEGLRFAERHGFVEFERYVLPGDTIPYIELRLTERAKPAVPADWRAANRANWDERVPIHTAAEFYDVPGFVAGNEVLREFELTEVGDVDGKTLLHLQCHIGLDTLAWARRGATVTGLDFSAPAVAVAAGLAAQIGATSARFVTSDVYEAVGALDGQTFDIVYTGLGALNWLPEIDRWARTAAALVAPGGFLYLAEFHPFADVLAEDGRTVETDYFDREPSVWDRPGTYADWSAETTATVTVQWQHGLGEVVSALTAAGLRLEFLREHDFSLFARFPVLEQRDGFRFPEGQPRVPLLYRCARRRRSESAVSPLSAVAGEVDLALEVDVSRA